MLRIDIGCGHAKRDGFVGIDKDPAPGVDHVVDVERAPLPFGDRTVEAIFSSHCLEHLADQALIFHEMSRVAADGATLEIWTPYAWTDEAFVYTHRTFFTELHYLHPCVMFPDHWQDILGARWQLRELQFVVSEPVQADLARHGVGLDFALKYLKGVAVELGAHITIWHGDPPAPHPPRRTYSSTREGVRRPIASADTPARRPTGALRGWLRSFARPHAER